MLTKLNFWPEKVYFRLSLCHIHRWMTWWMMTGETNICVIIRKWFATLSKNSSDSATFFEKSTETEIHWYSIPNFDGASWVTSSISSFRVSKPLMSWRVCSTKKDNIYSSSFFLQKNTQKPTHPILKDTNVYRVLHTCGYLTVLFANELGDRTEGFVLRNARLSKSTENPDLLLLPFSSFPWLI